MAKLLVGLCLACCGRPSLTDRSLCEPGWVGRGGQRWWTPLMPLRWRHEPPERRS